MGQSVVPSGPRYLVFEGCVYERQTHWTGSPSAVPVGRSGVSLYRVQTACDRAGCWQIEAFVADRDEADRMVEAFQAQGERANVTTIDLSDPLERDSACHNLTAFFQSLKARANA